MLRGPNPRSCRLAYCMYLRGAQRLQRASAHAAPYRASFFSKSIGFIGGGSARSELVVPLTTLLRCGGGNAIEKHRRRHWRRGLRQIGRPHMVARAARSQQAASRTARRSAAADARASAAQLWASAGDCFPGVHRRRRAYAPLCCWRPRPCGCCGSTSAAAVAAPSQVQSIMLVCCPIRKRSSSNAVMWAFGIHVASLRSRHTRFLHLVHAHGSL